MRKITTLLFILFICNYSFGQITPQWISNYGGVADFSYTVSDMVTDKSGNVYECGYQQDSSYLLGIVIKYNSAGVQQWVDTSSLIQTSSKITIDKIGNVYITCPVSGFSFSSDYLTRKYNSSGITQWTSFYNGAANKTDRPNAIIVDDSLNVYVTGEACESTGYIRSYSTVKYNSLGIQQWVAKTGTGEDDRSNAVAVDSLQNVYVTGQSPDTLNGTLLTVKYDKYGIEQWQRRYSSGGIYSLGLFIDVSNNGFIYVGGIDFDFDNMDFLAMKYDGSGNEIWASTYDAQASLSYSAYDLPEDMFVDNTGNIYLTGIQFQGTSSDDYCTTKFDKNGNLKWARSYNGFSGWDEARGVVADEFGNVYITGESEDTPLNTRVLATIKYDSIGNILWVAKHESTIDTYRSTEIGLDSLNNVYVAGSSINSAASFFVTLKYDKLTGVNNLTTQSEIIIYPNPVFSNFTMEFDLNETKNTSIEIKNILGQSIKMISSNSLIVGNNKIEIDVTEFPNGIYFVQLNNERKTTCVKLIKQ